MNVYNCTKRGPDTGKPSVIAYRIRATINSIHIVMDKLNIDNFWTYLGTVIRYNNISTEVGY